MISKNDKKFGLPSSITIDAEKIYKLMEVKINKIPYLL